MSIEWAAAGAFETASSIRCSSNNLDSIFLKLFVVPVPVIFVDDARASEPNCDDTFGATKRRCFGGELAGVKLFDELVVGSGIE